MLHCPKPVSICSNSSPQAACLRLSAPKRRGEASECCRCASILTIRAYICLVPYVVESVCPTRFVRCCCCCCCCNFCLFFALLVGLITAQRTLLGRRNAGAASVHTSATLSLGGTLTFDNNTASNDGGAYDVNESPHRTGCTYFEGQRSLTD